MSERTKHSKLGIASTILPLGIWIYLGVSLYLLFQTDFFSKFYNSYLSNNKSGTGAGMADIAVLVFLMLFFFIVLPVLGHLLGVILGIIGVFVKTKKRFFAVLGLFLNTFPFINLLILYLIPA